MNDVVVRTHITLLDAEPAIWRRLEVPASFTLKGLHDAIQLAIGWCDGHLHHFEIGGVLYGVPAPDDGSFPREVVNERRMKLGTLLRNGDRVFTYTYDYGDDWQCAIVLEAATPAADGIVFPRLIDGARAGPPDDVGGIWGYAEFLEALADPEHEEHDRLVEWSGGDFDPERLDIAEINRVLTRLAPKKAVPRKSRAAVNKKPRP